MKKLIYISVIAFLLVNFMGCRKEMSEIEATLVGIDSLISSTGAAANRGTGGSPADSALALLNDIDTASLRGENRAYHALLTAQAMYKAYIPATSDSIINRAWDYYQDHGSYDRRIRAMLYKGTTAEELGRLEEAMRWYKNCEYEAKQDDYKNKGFSYLRMAYLYQFQYVAPEKAILLFRKALDEFKTGTDRYYQMVCMTQLGMVYRLVRTDSARFYAKQAAQYANYLKDTINYFRNIESLTGGFYEDQKWDSTLIYALEGIQSPLSNTKIACYNFAAQANIYLGNLEAASDLIKSCPSPISTRDSVLFLRTIALYDSVRHNYRKSANNSALASQIASSALKKQQKINYGIAEQQPIIDKLKLSNKRLSTQVIFQYGFTFILLAVLFFLFINLILLFKKYKAEKSSFIKIKNDLYNLKLKLQEYSDNETINQKNALNFNSIKSLELQKYCINEIFKSVIYSGQRGTSIFKLIFMLESKKHSSLISIKLPDEFWINLADYINFTYPHAFENIKQNGLSLNEKEIRIISLDCLSIPNAVIERTLGYSERSLAPIRSKLISKIGHGETDMTKIMQNYSSK